MAKNFANFLLLAAVCGCWIAVECKKLSELGLPVRGKLSEDEDVDADDPKDEQWNKFKAKRGRKFKGDEEAKKKANFKASLRRVAEQNKKFLQGQSSFKTRIHAYSDWSHDEIKKNLMGLSKPPDESKIVRRPAPGRRPPGQKFYPGKSGKHRRQTMPSINAINYAEWGYVSKVKDQTSHCGSCWAFAAAGVLEALQYSYSDSSPGKVALDLSAQNLVDCSRNYANNGCEGGWPMNALQWVKANGGIMTEQQYKYTGLDNQACQYNAAYKAPAINVVDTLYTLMGNESDLMWTVYFRGPVAVAVDADGWGVIDYSYGVYNNISCTTNGHHAVLVVGYGKDDASGLDYWLVKNSWGTDWGTVGYAKLARNKGNQCGIASFGQFATFE